MFVHTHTHARTHAHTHGHARTHTHTHTHTRTHTHTHTHDCVSWWSWRVSVWSVCFDWREACLPLWCNRKHGGHVSQRYRYESRRGEWALFPLMPSALTFIFLWHTHKHAHTHTNKQRHTHTHTCTHARTPEPISPFHSMLFCNNKILGILVIFYVAVCPLSSPGRGGPRVWLALRRWTSSFLFFFFVFSHWAWSSLLWNM